MIFSNHMAVAFPAPSPLSTSPYVVLPSDHHHDMMRRSVSLSGGTRELGHEFHNGFPNGCRGGGGDDDLSDDGSQMLGEKKKKRLSLEQVKALERSFETRNKLEPERKTQLARSLGLQPRQVAIWFQNRRARWKTKQLERDYEVLKRQVKVLRDDNDALHAQNEKLRVEIKAIKARRDKSESKSRHVKNATAAAAECSFRCKDESDVGCDVNPDTSRTSLIDSFKLDQNDVFCNGAVVESFWPWAVAAAADHHPLHQS